MKNADHQDGPGASDPELTITIQTTKGDKTYTVPKTTKVSEIISRLITDCGFAPGDRFELVLASNPQEVLQSERPLVSYHIQDGTRLILTMFGSGV